MLMANSAAILTDAFPENQRGMAMGVNQAAAFSGSFIGLILGGILAPINWRLIFLVSVPIGLFATIWGYLQLRELGQRRSAHIDWSGNATFALGLVRIMVGITYGIEPYGGHAMGWTSPPGDHLPGPGRRSSSSLSASSRCGCASPCSRSVFSKSAPSPPVSSPASWPPSAAVASCSSSSSGSRASGFPCTATPSPPPRCGRASP